MKIKMNVNGQPLVLSTTGETIPKLAKVFKFAAVAALANNDYDTMMTAAILRDIMHDVMCKEAV